ncbi:UDP-N-acetylmuramate dehydrogenase [Novacetimonas hansenii]|uniref:UDP-N-acetylmuramate dehydrogenase n=1 Tax=Novacetimonas hansenii TaxID=436 RepID=UPI000798BC1A|nr:UDP-N-acetylmuramate dehydrogenase [Novacetimonas hansenii]WEQ59118.1 UDP-N-acetylmuramate dehydrogenase [Novacetimonas hansenii]CUW47353.1 UDP-N-acetylenolpyruvoylglucosamine reductase [Novacetimonas hansenii]
MTQAATGAPAAPTPVQWREDLIRALVEFRGRLTPDAPLGPRTWFRVGGAAELLVQPADARDLALALRHIPLEVPVRVLGACSNTIIRDGGIDGVVIRLGRGFADIAHDGNGLIAGAACLDMTVAEHAATCGLAGMEFLAGIPGALGGAVSMNAGAYGSDISNILDWVEIITRDGEALRLPGGALKFSYRHALVPQGAVVVRTRLCGQPSNGTAIRERIAQIRAAREAAQPVRARTGGSTFRNPAPDISDRKAWELIDAAGCRGLTLGGAQVSEKHCNFLLNTGAATAAELEELGERVRARVREHTGVTLEWEIRRIGRPAAHPPEQHPGKETPGKETTA